MLWYSGRPSPANYRVIDPTSVTEVVFVSRSKRPTSLLRKLFSHPDIVDLGTTNPRQVSHSLRPIMSKVHRRRRRVLYLSPGDLSWQWLCGPQTVRKKFRRYPNRPATLNHDRGASALVRSTFPAGISSDRQP